MSFQDTVLNKIRELNLKTFKASDLANKLNFRSVFEKRELYKSLNILVSENYLAYANKEKDKFLVVDSLKLIKGVLKGNKRGFAFLIREDKKEDLFIPNKSLNGALHKDKVFVKIVKGDEGEVVSIIERGVSEVVGKYKATGENSGFVISDDDSFFEYVYINDNTLNAKHDYKVVTKITDYKNGKFLNGCIKEVLGKAGEISSEVISILRTHGFSEEFDNAVIKDCERLASVADNAKRVDYSNILTITIDGDDAKDFDDAISLIKNKDGFKLYVHIADVTSYVKQNSIVDKEARFRGTSVYFPNKAYPMLPSLLSEELCSLKPNVKRNVLTCVMDIDLDGNVKTSKLEEGIITSDERMTYKNVTKILNGDELLIKSYKNIIPMLQYMNELAGILFNKRKIRGAINFESKEASIELDEKFYPIDIQPYPYEISNRIIEEFMLLANETVAEFVFHMGYPFVYRVHEKPFAEKISLLKVFLGGFGIPFVTKEIYSNQFSNILESVSDSPFKSVINKAMLRSMNKAKYSSDQGEHFGLAARYYCHFTSPIRRYPDLTIHRVIKDIINGRMNEKKLEMYNKLVQEVSLSSTERERAAELAEREVDDFYKALYMKNKINEEYDGVISGMNNFRLFVELPNTVEGSIDIISLDGDNYKYDEKNYTLSNGIIMFKLGERVKIKVIGASELERRVDFALIKKIDNTEIINNIDKTKNGKGKANQEKQTNLNRNKNNKDSQANNNIRKKANFSTNINNDSKNKNDKNRKNKSFSGETNTRKGNNFSDSKNASIENKDKSINASYKTKDNTINKTKAFGKINNKDNKINDLEENLSNNKDTLENKTKNFKENKTSKSNTKNFKNNKEKSIKINKNTNSTKDKIKKGEK